MEGCRRINVLIGPPNVGKSNILEALGLFHYVENHTNSFQDIVRIHELRDLFNNWDVGKEISINIDNTYLVFGEYNDKGQGDFSFHLKSPNAQVSGSKTNFDFVKSFVVGADKAINEVGVSPEDIGDLPKIKFYKYKEQTNYIKKNFIALEPPFGINLLDTIVLHPNLRKSIAQLLKLYNLKMVVELENHELKFSRFFDEETFVNVPFYLFADTLKRLIFFQTAVLSNKDAVLLFEEPEAHCYPPYISKMLKEIIFDDNRNQFFIVTHSPYVLNELMEHAQEDTAFFLVNIDNESSTTVHQLNKDEVHDAYQYGYDFFMNMEEFSKQKEVYG